MQGYLSHQGEDVESSHHGELLGITEARSSSWPLYGNWARNKRAPYHTIPYHTIPYHTVPSPSVPCHTMLYCAIQVHILPEHSLHYKAYDLVSTITCLILTFQNIRIFVRYPAIRWAAPILFPSNQRVQELSGSFARGQEMNRIQVVKLDGFYECHQLKGPSCFSFSWLTTFPSV